MSSEGVLRQAGEAIDLQTRLLESPEWCALTPIQMYALESAAQIREFAKEDLLFDQDAPCTGLHIVRSGMVAVRKRGPGEQCLLLKVAHAGNTLGYQPLLARQSHNARAQALTDGSAWFVAKEIVVQLFSENPAVSRNVMWRIATDLGDIEDRLHETNCVKLKTRLLHLLGRFDEEFGAIDESGKRVTELPVSRYDLADMLGVRRESLSRLIHELNDDGAISLHGRFLEVPR